MAPPAFETRSEFGLDEIDDYVAGTSEEEDGEAGDMELGNVVQEAEEAAERAAWTYSSSKQGGAEQHAKGEQHAQQPQYTIAHKGRQRQPPGDARPLLLFDLNGVLMHHRFNGTSHSHDLRPGVHHLLRLCRHYRLGIFSSATRRTVLTAVQKLHANLALALRQFPAKHRQELPEQMPEQLFEVIMCREHCRPAAKEDIAARGGKPWDTVKPLGSHFADLTRVLLVDDSPHKAVPEEQANMLVVPAWAGPPEQTTPGAPAPSRPDNGLQLLAEELLLRAEAAAADARRVAAEVSQRLLAAAGLPVPAARASPVAAAATQPKQQQQQQPAAPAAALLHSSALAPLKVLVRAAAAAVDCAGAATVYELNLYLQQEWARPTKMLMGRSAKAALAAALAAGQVQEQQQQQLQGPAQQQEQPEGAGGSKQCGKKGSAAGLPKRYHLAGATAQGAGLPSLERLQEISNYCSAFESRGAFLARHGHSKAGQVAAAPAAASPQQQEQQAQAAGGSPGQRRTQQQQQAGTDAAGETAPAAASQPAATAALALDGFFWEKQAQQQAAAAAPQAESAAGEPSPSEVADAMTRDLLLHALATLQQRKGAAPEAIIAHVAKQLQHRAPQLAAPRAPVGGGKKKRKRAAAAGGQQVVSVLPLVAAALDACSADGTLVRSGCGPRTQQLLQLLAPAGPAPTAAETEAALQAAVDALAGAAAGPGAQEAQQEQQQEQPAAHAADPAVPAAQAGSPAKRARPEAAAVEPAVPAGAAEPAEAAAAPEAALPRPAAEAPSVGQPLPQAGGEPAGEQLPLLLEVFEDRGRPLPSQPPAAPVAVPAHALPVEGQQEQQQPQLRGDQDVTAAAAAPEHVAAEGSPVKLTKAQRRLHREALQLGLPEEQVARMSVEEKKAARKAKNKAKKQEGKLRAAAATALLDRLQEAAIGAGSKGQAAAAGAAAAAGPAERWAEACGQLSVEDRQLLLDHGIDLDTYYSEVFSKLAAVAPVTAAAAASSAAAAAEDGGMGVDEDAAGLGAGQQQQPLLATVHEVVPAIPQPAIPQQQQLLLLPATPQQQQQLLLPANPQQQQQLPLPAVPQQQQLLLLPAIPQQQQQQLSPLHYEVAAFAAAATPTPAEASEVQAAVQAVDAAARQLWPYSSTVLFGSQATGLALPGSDLDIVVLGVGAQLLRAGTGFTQVQRRQLSELLEDLLDALLAQRLIRGKAQIIEARVPIIKCCLNVGNGLMADISLGAANGAAAVDFVRRQVMAVSPLRPLCLAVKAFLRQRGLNEVFTGGLSSYSLVNMVLAHLLAEGYQAALDPPQHPDAALPADLGHTFAFLHHLSNGLLQQQPLQQLPQQPYGSFPPAGFAPGPSGASGSNSAPAPWLEQDLGVLLWGFFQRFGSTFSYSRQAVSLRRGGVCGKIKAWKQSKKPWLLAVEDPQEEGKDIGSGSFNIREIQAAFAAAAGTLAEACEDLDANNAAAAAAAAAAGGAGPSQQLPGPGRAGRGGLLAAVVDWELAVGRGPAAERARRVLEERAAAKSAAIKHARIRRGISVVARAPASKRPSQRRGAAEVAPLAPAQGGGSEKKRGSKRGRQVEAAWGNKHGQYHEDSDGDSWAAQQRKRKRAQRKAARKAQGKQKQQQQNAATPSSGKRKGQGKQQQQQQQQSTSKKKQKQRAAKKPKKAAG